MSFSDEEKRVESWSSNHFLRQPAKRSRTRSGYRWMLVGTATLLATWGYFNLHLTGIKDFRDLYNALHPASDSGEEICLTPACVHASSELLYNLSPDYETIDPCTNFEELVCGGWKDRHDLRPDQGDAFTGTIMFESSQALLRHILESPYPGSSSHSYFSPAQLDAVKTSYDEENFVKLQAAYNACMDEKAIKAEGSEPLKWMLKIISSFYTGDSENPLSDTILVLQQMQANGLLTMFTGADDKDPDRMVVSVSAPYQFGLPAQEMYKDTVILGKYENVLAETMTSLYPDKHFNTSLFHELVFFEKKLADHAPSAQDRNDVTKYYNPMSLSEANALVPSISIASIVERLAPDSITPERLIVMAPSYLKALERILAETPHEVLHGYFLWKVLQSYYYYVEAAEVESYKRFMNELSGKDPDSVPERWRTCVGHVDEGLGWILSRFFVEKAFSAEAKDFGDQIVSDIKGQFIEKLKSTSWMDKNVTELAIDKVHNIVQKIGYPTKSPNIMDPKDLSVWYGEVEVGASNFFNNTLYMIKDQHMKMWNALAHPVDRNEWGMTVPTVNAYYNPPGNEIVFPAGIMQFPVFDVSLPAYLSYGAFGSVSGHELSHAFDSTGRHYDQIGNYTDWWTPNTVKAFESRAECFVEQYSNFTLEGTGGKTLHVNGRLTLGENIADAGGVSAAFKAWKRRAEEKPNKNLPGLDFFTQEQLFFVSYANWWCGKSTTETAENRIYLDPHAPKWARIIGTMANSRDFKKSFQCKNKEPVCELW